MITIKKLIRRNFYGLTYKQNTWKRADSRTDKGLRNLDQL